ncbi:MAG TPA: 30S ribosomal protein S20 [Acidobacteriota bacterium]|nr:30S ribosomal protein S20 [Acidobacteriota bacterium]HNB71494.1 30S ribosomal protein S20 [Acidobacteriota bacterium]HND22548.1 30S ribosomal protein S20 [Acidobacteriota bacterium]HNG94497.1 30S ribosomal protein S20 [Acidobacteriota bacterium]HNH81036.1 30S ribosomal protein S20 [Acidobacteriota bacterium]
MPNHESAIKRDRQNKRRNEVNRKNRARVRTFIKKLRSLLSVKTKDEAIAQLPPTISAIDKAVQKGVIHQNAAARYKSRLTLHVNKLSAS